METLLLSELKNIHLIYKTYKEWISELDFIADEETILTDLLNSHFIELCNFELYNQSKKIVEEIKLNKQQLNRLKTDIYILQKYLATLIESNNTEGEKEFYIKHQQLSDKKIAFIIKVNRLKTTTYELFKTILKKGKQLKIQDNTSNF